jgi:hypothetical protein
MAVFSGPEIAKSGIILSLDAANRNSYVSGPENLALYSEEFQISNWNSSSFGTNATVTANAIASPFGELTADLLTFAPDGTGQSRREQVVLFATGVYTTSVFVKKGTLSTINLFVTLRQSPFPNVAYNFDTDTISNGNGIIASSRVLYPDGWVRISATASVTAHSSGIGLLSGISGTVYAWGFQCERGNTVTDYNKTGASSFSSPTTFTDLNSNRIKNNATLVNRPLFSSFGGGSISFDGSTNYISLSRNDFNTSLPNFTISALVYKTANGIILGNHFHNSTWESIWFDTGNFIVNGANNSTTNRQVLSYTTPSNSWMNLVAVNSSTQNYMKVFLNGAELATRTATVIPWSSSVIPTIGAQLTVSTNALQVIFGGNISQVFVYDRALTAAEIAQNYNSFRGRFAI